MTGSKNQIEISLDVDKIVVPRHFTTTNFTLNETEDTFCTVIVIDYNDNRVFRTRRRKSGFSLQVLFDETSQAAASAVVQPENSARAVR